MKLAGAPLLLAALAACEPTGTPLRYDLGLGTQRYREITEEVVRASDGSLVRLTQIEADVRVQLAREGDAATVAVHHEAARGRRLEAATGGVAVYDVQFPDRPGGDPAARAALARALDQRFDRPATWKLAPQGPTEAQAWPWHLPLPDRLRPDASWQATLPLPGEPPAPVTARFVAATDLEGVPCSELAAEVALPPAPPAELRVCVSPTGAVVWQSLHRRLVAEGRTTEITIRRVALTGGLQPAFSLPLDPPALARPQGPAGRDRLGDALPPGALARLGTTRGLAPADVRAIVPGPVGAQVALLHADGVTVLDARTGVVGWHERTPAPAALAWSPDGSRLLSAGADGQLTWWRAADGGTLRTASVAAEPRAVALAASGEALVGAADGRLWRVAEAARAVDLGVGPVAALALLRDQLAAAGPGGVAVLTLGTDARRLVSEAPTLAVGWLPGGLLTLGSRGLTWWDVATGQVAGALPLSGKALGSAWLTTSPAGRFALWGEGLGGAAGSVHDGQLTATAQPGRHLCTATDGGLLIATGADDRVVSASLPGEPAVPGALWRAVALDGEGLVSLDARGEVRSWALTGGARPLRWSVPDATTLADRADGGLVAAGPGGRWSLGPDGTAVPAAGPGATGLLSAGAALLALGADGARLEEGGAQRWHLTQGEPCAATLSADGQRAAVALRTGDAVQIRTTPHGEVALRTTTLGCRLALSADGTRLAVLGPAPTRVRVLAVPEGGEVARVAVPAPGGVVGALALDVTGRRLAVGGAGQVALYDLAHLQAPELPDAPHPPTLLFTDLDPGLYVDLRFTDEHLLGRPEPGTSALVLDATDQGRLPPP
ncbi:MAG: hypothetical protein R3F60_16525 [bacterium]